MTETLMRADSFEAAEAVPKGDGAAEPEVPPSPPVTGHQAMRVSTAILRRRSLPIRGYVGGNGSGKTATAVLDLIPSIYAGRPILSTTPIFDHRTGELYEGYIPFDSWDYLLDDRFRSADILMDEVTGIANARQSQSMPVQVQAALDKLRKRDLTLSWTAPAWGRADTTIRTTSWGVTLCRSYLPKRPESTSSAVAAWRPRRLFRVRTFDALGFEDFNRARAEGNTVRSKPLRAEVVQWWWGPGHPAFASYRTMDSVLRVGEVLDSGRCAHCGGTRPVPKCSCPPARLPDSVPHVHDAA
jgi:hypothetical protein